MNKWHKSIFFVTLMVSSVAYSNPLWVAVGGTGNPDGGDSGIIVTSPDGNAWSAPALSIQTNNMDLRSVAYNGAGTWIAVGENVATRQPLIIASPEPTVDWKVIDLPPALNNIWLYDISYGNGMWVAVGEDKSKNPSLPIIMTSPDGFQNWTVQPITLPAPADQGVLYHVTYGNGKWVAAGDAAFDNYSWGSGMIFTSQDAIHWDIQLPTDPQKRLPALNNGIVYNGNQWMIIGKSGLSNTAILTSKDASSLSSWNINYFTSDCDFNNATYANGQWTMVGHISSHQSCILLSKDATNWVVPQTSYTDGSLIDIAYGNNRLVTVGVGSYGAISQDNGNTWSSIQTSTLAYPVLNRIIYSD